MQGKTDGTSRWEKGNQVRQLRAGVLLVAADVHVSRDPANEANTRRNSNEQHYVQFECQFCQNKLKNQLSNIAVST